MTTSLWHAFGVHIRHFAVALNQIKTIIFRVICGSLDSVPAHAHWCRLAHLPFQNGHTSGLKCFYFIFFFYNIFRWFGFSADGEMKFRSEGVKITQSIIGAVSSRRQCGSINVSHAWLSCIESLEMCANAVDATVTLHGRRHCVAKTRTHNN